MKTRTIAVAALLVLTYVRPAAGQSSDCGALNSAAETAGQFSTAIWCTNSGGAVSLLDIVKSSAPVVWFSPDEPLMNDVGGDQGIPSAIPQLWEWPAWSFGGGRFVFFPIEPNKRRLYFQVREVAFDRHYPGTPATRSRFKQMVAHHIADPTNEDDLAVRWRERPSTDELDLAALRSVDIRFFFYYPVDVGVGGHLHDLESMQVHVVFDKPHCGACQQSSRARVQLVSGAAHGIGWYTSTLDVGDPDASDTRFPLTVLVEEGKHATAPDRNGDGMYTPSYDVTLRINDAWGVRDTMRTKRLVSSTYRAEMDKTRTWRTKVVPADSPQWMLDRYWQHFKEEPSGKIPQYALERSDSRADLCEGEAASQAVRDRGDGLYELLNGMEFCRHTRHQLTDTATVTAAYALLRKISPGPTFSNNPYTNPFVARISTAYRYDSGPGATVIVPAGLEVPGLGGWAVVRASVTFTNLKAPYMPPVSRGGWEALYTPSASRFVDWYLSAGFERIRLDDQLRRWSPVQEVGIKFRFRPVEFLGFLGARAGIRSTEIDGTRVTRYVFDLGGGTW